MNEKNNLLLPLTILSLSIVVSVIIFSSVWSAARSADQTITVTGSAKQEITSNFAVLRGTLITRNFNASSAYTELQNQMPSVLKFLSGFGFEKEDVEFFTINSYPIFELNNQGYQTQNISSYVYNQRIEIKSSDVFKIKEISLALASLIEKGIEFNVEPPEYLFTNIDELKISMQAEAALNAKMRAEQIAEATDRSLGPLRNARMGVIQITPKNSNMVSDYGFNDTSSIEKEITAVVSASFEID
ncbi:MAG: SIMPL domain-containing protein [Melioribacteraceae bacterium]|nr:SIMPL domain-containing protein [Melioribacteraceae bacterium]MCF8356524.1 SIMPL domain-containing protein [Melioribacteraceae bacterium]MCF8395913.1 SIMPL domain-containing protein [Melioribacteraceae bacterium]MCF8420980.1 SIMPL domain-containing protein [Melioribacteraceae bacterium]